MTQQWLVDECSSESPNQAQLMKNLEFSSITVPTDDTLEGLPSLSPQTLPVEQLQLKDRIVCLASELNDKPTWHFPALRSTPRTKLREAVKEINAILSHIPTQNLIDIHHLLFAAAVVVCELCDVKFVDIHAIQDEPPWKR